MKYITIDGAQGEGGGQVLRTALTLSMLTQQPIELINIRANRQKPGLMRQHLTSVLAAQTICDAAVEGAELGSSHIRFQPKQVKAGQYQFAIGTAGSTVLVCQTIMPVLALANGISTVTFEGGTHNGMSPSLCFFKESYLPILNAMGVQSDIEVSQLGFYPAGGGKWQIKINPTKQLKPFKIGKAPDVGQLNTDNTKLAGFVSQLPDSIAMREMNAAKKALNWPNADCQINHVQSPGPGNSLQIKIQSQSHTHLFEVVGELGTSAENIAKRCAGRVKAFLKSNSQVEHYLADQLLVLMALAGSGSFTTSKPSLHTLTNAQVIQQITKKEINIQQESEHVWRISLTST